MEELLEEQNSNRKEVKRRFQLWLKPSTLELADSNFEKDNCASRSEFIEKAIIFYAGYLSAEDNKQYLPGIITSTLKGIVSESDHKTSGVLFKIAVELAILQNLIAATNEVDEVTMTKLRGECIKEVKKLHGVFSFEKAMDWQSDDE